MPVLTFNAAAGPPCASLTRNKPTVTADFRSGSNKLSTNLMLKDTKVPRPGAREVAGTAKSTSDISSMSSTSKAQVVGRGLEYTSYESNSWMALFSLTGACVLVDPWLVDHLVFAGVPWFYKGTKRVFKAGPEAAREVASKSDLILLTQALPDHAHVPTLEALPKSIPIVASPGAAMLAQSLGFTAVTSIDHGQQVTVCDGKLKITGTAGALVGPPWSKRENGFVIEELVEGGVKLYYEPHCDFDESSVASVAPVDVVVTPPTSQILGGYAVVKGATENMKLLKTLGAKKVIALMNADIDAAGVLSSLLVEQGSVEQLQKELKAAGLSAEVVVPPAGTPVPIAL